MSGSTSPWSRWTSSTSRSITFGLRSLSAEMAQAVQLSVGVDADLGKVELNIQGVEAQALVKARLDDVGAILERVLST